MKELKIRGRENQKIMVEMKKESFFPTDKGNFLTFEEFKNFIEKNSDKVEKIKIETKELDKEMLIVVSLVENLEYLVLDGKKMLKIIRNKNEIYIVSRNGRKVIDSILTFSNSKTTYNDIFGRRDEAGFGYACYEKREYLSKFKGLLKVLELPSHEFETDMELLYNWIKIDKRMKETGDSFHKFSTSELTVNTSYIAGNNYIEEIFFETLEVPFSHPVFPVSIDYASGNELIIATPEESIEFCKTSKTADLFVDGNCYEIQDGELVETEGKKISTEEAKKLLKLFERAERYVSLEDFASIKRALAKVIESDYIFQNLKLIEELEF